MNSKSISLSMLFVDYSVSINRYTQNLATPYVFIKCFPPGFIHATFNFLTAVVNTYTTCFSIYYSFWFPLTTKNGGRVTFTFSFLSAAASSISASSISRFRCKSALYRAFCFLVLSFLGLSPVLSYSRSLNCSALAKYRLQSNLNILIPGIWINWNI